jgi:hypothetical protein
MNWNEWQVQLTKGDGEVHRDGATVIVARRVGTKHDEFLHDLSRSPTLDSEPTRDRPEPTKIEIGSLAPQPGLSDPEPGVEFVAFSLTETSPAPTLSPNLVLGTRPSLGVLALEGGQDPVADVPAGGAGWQ